MRHPPRFLYVFLMAALLVRVALGAPCCLPGAAHGPAHGEAHAAETAPDATPQGQMAMLHDASNASMAHDSHGAAAGEDAPAEHDEGDNTANPCCSACGPTLAGTSPQLASSLAPQRSYADTPAAPLAPRDLIRLYQATGPPLTV